MRENTAPYKFTVSHFALTAERCPPLPAFSVSTFIGRASQEYSERSNNSLSLKKVVTFHKKEPLFLVEKKSRLVHATQKTFAELRREEQGAQSLPISWQEHIVSILAFGRPAYRLVVCAMIAFIIGLSAHSLTTAYQADPTVVPKIVTQVQQRISHDAAALAQEIFAIRDSLKQEGILFSSMGSTGL